ncbi:histidine kinase dimerization/phospho-acceptor domain-containing protein [Paracoccus sp. MBLB3053]|uniref:histidine kinase n=1 Tax=Paracoccus aurantius TaxID=3073814 RepID=A0ABU2HUP3_9RHOB|nr:histidine kinase dimerization/phospho-acceptor domain-containing protein [Paracoccus sp. MBLB3053]MDS9468772.1 histidine kinase dimerization/phospho-acceptor domain-containing protein [Paracoccus sp. MBLB3053]
MSRDWSLRSRLTRRLVLGVSIGWLTGLAIAIFVISHEMTELLDDSLKASAHVASAAFAAGQVPEGLDLDPDHAIRILKDGVESNPAPWPAQRENGAHQLPGWRIYRLSRDRDALVVEVGQSDEWRKDELLESVEALLVLMLPVLLVVLLTVRRTIATALDPALRFAARMKDRPAMDLSPFADAGLPRELQPIPVALNGYLQRINNHVESERQFATNAAHELRTPLASASAQAQLIAAGRGGAHAARAMTAALDRLGRIIERLLQLSRAEAGIGGQSRCDLLRIIRIVITAEERASITFDDGDIEQAEIAIHPDAAALLLGNALRNAIDHGTGPVSVTLRPGPVLRIRNPVAPGAEFRHETFAKSTGSTGAGLGLTIMRKIAERNGLGFDARITGEIATLTLDFSARAVRPAD